jgi:hypothetical protein
MSDKVSFRENYKFVWTGHFLDGTFLHQFDADGSQHVLAELEARADKLDYIEIAGLPFPAIINVPKSSKPVIFERHRLETDGVNEIRCVWYYFGWHLKTEAAETKGFLVIHEQNGQLLLLSSEFDDALSR